MTPPLDPLPGNRCPSAEQYEALARQCDVLESLSEISAALRAAASLARENAELREMNRQLRDTIETMAADTFHGRYLKRAESAERERDAAKEKVRVLDAVAALVKDWHAKYGWYTGYRNDALNELKAALAKQSQPADVGTDVGTARNSNPSPMPAIRMADQGKARTRRDE